MDTSFQARSIFISIFLYTFQTLNSLASIVRNIFPIIVTSASPNYYYYYYYSILVERVGISSPHAQISSRVRESAPALFAR